jgi:hypothetical protein
MIRFIGTVAFSLIKAAASDRRMVIQKLRMWLFFKEELA